MPYYGAGDYYRGGDNYAGRGDFLGIGRALKKIQPLKLIGNLLGSTPVGTVARTLVPGISGRQIVAPIGNQLPVPGIGGAISRILPGGETGYYTRRRMNYGNMKALRRASRRAHGFLKAVRGAVKYFVPKSPKGKAYVAFKRRKK